MRVKSSHLPVGFFWQKMQRLYAYHAASESNESRHPWVLSSAKLNRATLMKHCKKEIPRNASKFSIVKKLYLNSKEETAFALLQIQLKIKLRIGDSPVESTFHFLLTVFAQASYSLAEVCGSTRKLTISSSIKVTDAWNTFLFCLLSGKPQVWKRKWLSLH